MRYAEVAEGVGKAFQKADPDHAADYRKNTAALVKDLKALDEKFRTGLANRTTDVFVTTHAAFGYLAERYGLTEEAISGLDPDTEPSGARVKELQKIAKEDGVTTVFYETLVSDKTAKTLARRHRAQDRRPRPGRGHHRPLPRRGLLPGHGGQPHGPAHRAGRPVTPDDATSEDGMTTEPVITLRGCAPSWARAPCCAESTSPCTAARSSPCSAPTAPASPPPCAP